jgi:nucleoside-diphosphate-sugar epimerase
MKRIAILGANGFLGKYLSKFLAVAGHTILPVTRKTLDLTNYWQVAEWLAVNKPDVVISCIITGGTWGVNDISYTNVQTDLSIFTNFFNNTKCPRYINIGSGAEFDRRRSLNNCVESEILYNTPIDSYGYAKNVIARLCLPKDNFYTLRLFGCFDHTELDSRLFKKFLHNKTIIIDEKYFDYISALDFALIVKHYCETDKLVGKDVNCVYNEKILLSELLRKFAGAHVPDGKIIVNPNPGLDYTGSGNLLHYLKIPLVGLDQGIKNYV